MGIAFCKSWVWCSDASLNRGTCARTGAPAAEVDASRGAHVWFVDGKERVVQLSRAEIFAVAAMALLGAAAWLYQAYKEYRWFRVDSPAARGDSSDTERRPHP